MWTRYLNWTNEGREREGEGVRESQSNSVIFHFNVSDHYFAKWTSTVIQISIAFNSENSFIHEKWERERERRLLLVAIKLQPQIYSTIELKTYYRFIMM